MELFAQSDAGTAFVQYLLLGLVLGSLYALIALGYTMVYGIIELINFAHGDLFMLGSFLALGLAVWPMGVTTADAGGDEIALTVILMLVAAPLFCAALNVLADRVIYKPLRASPKLTVIVSAIGVAFIFQNAGLFWRGATPVKFPDLISDANVFELTVRWQAIIAGGLLVALGLGGIGVSFLARTSPRSVIIGAVSTAVVCAGSLAGGLAAFGPLAAAVPLLDETREWMGLRLTWIASGVVVGLGFRFLAGPSPRARRLGAVSAAVFGVGLLTGSVAVVGPLVTALPLLDERPWQGIGLRFTWKDALVVGVTAPAMIALTVFVRFTALGKAMRATAQNPTAAQLMGINADRVIAATFAIGGALAGVASVVYGLYIKSVDYQMGFQNGLYAFTAAVLGGIGNIPGAVLGGLVIGVVGELGKAYLGAKWSEALIFGILIVILLFRPTGLLGARTREKV